MALEVVWSYRARDERKAILRFYMDRNGNAQYSRELARHFNKGVELAARQEWMGKATDIEGVRCLLILEYSLFYVVRNNTLAVLSVWDNRQNPEKRPY